MQDAAALADAPDLAIPRHQRPCLATAGSARAAKQRRMRLIIGRLFEREEALVSNVVVKSPMQYLDKATGTLARSGPHARQGRGRADQRACCKKSPTSIRTGSPSSPARSARPASSTRWCAQQTQAIEIGERYRQIAEGFNSIRDDAKAMVDQIADAQDRPLGAGHQRLDEDLARRHRRPLRPDQGRPTSTSPARPRIRSSARP